MEDKKKIPRMLSIRKSAELSGLSYQRIKALCLSGNVPAIKSGNRIIVNFDGLVNYLSFHNLNSDYERQSE